jgi:CubicO group peptidase (beta-lactamase class C family)
VIAASAHAQSATPPSDSAILAILERSVDNKQSAGMVVALLDHGQPHIIAYGPTRPGGPPLDANTVFEIGSVTKVFTTTILADMVVKGEVKLDDPVAKYLPSSVHMPTRGGKEITLLDLATQTSGLPRLPANFAPKDPKNPYADYTVQQMYDFLSGYQLPRDIGATYEYSNLGMGLLGHALARHAGMSYEQLVTKRVLEPLGMRDTRITLNESMRSRLAQGHDDAGNPVAIWDLPTLAGAGALRSTANDMLKFIAAALDTTRGPLAKAFALAEPARRPAGQGLRIGLAWHTLRAFDQEIVWHNGQTGGYHTFIGLDHATGANVVVLASSSNNIDDIGLHVLDQRIPLRAAPKPHTEIALDPSVLDRYVGVYELAPTFSITITRDGNNLWAQATNQGKLQLFAESETDFFLKGLDAGVTFVRDSAGVVTGLVLHQQGNDQSARKVK